MQVTNNARDCLSVDNVVCKQIYLIVSKVTDFRTTILLISNVSVCTCVCERSREGGKLHLNAAHTAFRYSALIIELFGA
jgi:hypothetical protein